MTVRRHWPFCWHVAFLAMVATAGCTTPYLNQPSTGDKARQAMSQPFSDLNLSRTRIPAILRAARTAPFSSAASLDCVALANEIRTLTGHLGPVFSASQAHNPTGSHRTEDAAWRAVQSASGGIIPFRGVVRWMSGAERQDRELAQALLAGFVRRAYLEGIRDERRCPSAATSP